MAASLEELRVDVENLVDLVGSLQGQVTQLEQSNRDLEERLDEKSEPEDSLYRDTLEIADTHWNKNPMQIQSGGGVLATPNFKGGYDLDSPSVNLTNLYLSLLFKKVIEEKNKYDPEKPDEKSYNSLAVATSPAIFDLYYFNEPNKPTTFKIRGAVYNDATPAETGNVYGFLNGASVKWTSVAGVWQNIKQVAAGGSANFDEAITLDSDDLIYLYHEQTSSATNVYLERYSEAAANAVADPTLGRHLLQDGGDGDGAGHLYYPLHLLEWEVVTTDPPTGYIKRMLDLRPVWMINRMGN